MFDQYKVNLPEGSCSSYRIEHFTVSQDASRLDAVLALGHGSSRFTPPGTYTRLVRGSGIWPTTIMSDTPDEIRDHLEPIRRATGHCLINGLGLGVVVQGMLDKPEVEHVTVIEIAPEVIELVGTYYKARFTDRLTIIEADALTYKPPKGERFNVVWHDIWDEICTDNLAEIGTLHRKYGRRCDWQGSWCRELLQYYKRHSW